MNETVEMAEAEAKAEAEELRLAIIEADRLSEAARIERETIEVKVRVLQTAKDKYDHKS